MSSLAATRRKNCRPLGPLCLVRRYCAEATTTPSQQSGIWKEASILLATILCIKIWLFHTPRLRRCHFARYPASHNQLAGMYMATFTDQKAKVERYPPILIGITTA